MKPTLMVSIILCSGFHLCSSITLQQAIQQGIKNNFQCQNQVLQEKIQLIRQQSARLNRLFTITAGGSYLYRSQEMEIILPDVQAAPGMVIPGKRIQAGTKHNFDLKISLYQPLYTGNILSNLTRLEAINMKQEKNQTLLTKIETAAAIKISYYNYRSYLNKELAYQSMVKQLKLHRQKLANLFKEELITESSVLETEAKIQEWKLKLADLHLLKQQEKISFRKLCDLDIETISHHAQEHITDMMKSFAFFKQNHPMVSSLTQKMAALEYQKKIKRGETRPQVGGFSELHYGKPGIDFFKDQWSLYFQAGITIDLKLFQWNRSKRDITILDHQMAQLANQKKDVIKRGKTNLDQLFERLATLDEKMKMMQDLSAITRRDIQLKEQLLMEQQLSNLDYLAALTRNEQLVSQLNDLKVQQELVKVLINKTIGRYSEVQ